MSDAIATQGTRLAFADEMNSGALALTFAATGKTITRGSGDWTAGDWYVGQRIRTTNAANEGPFTIAAITSTVITVEETVVDDSNTATEIVYGDLDIGEVVSVGGIGSGESADIDVTHLRSAAKEFRVGLQDEGSVTLGLNFVPTDLGQQRLHAARAAQTLKSYRLTYGPTLTYFDTFSAYAKSAGRAGGVDGKYELSVTLRITGAVTQSDSQLEA